MNKKVKITVITVIILIILIIGWYLASPLFLNKKVNEDLSENALITYSGNFIDADDSHKASGTAKIATINSETYLRFEDFASTNVPDAHVYLSKDLTNNEFIDLGALKGNQGNQNYLIPENTDLEEYDKVLIWCVPFSVLVGSSDLEKI